ncbi:MAG: hypothetical protein HZA95_03510 [Candidatus Vogelbacteria bacterium]|nr:hypothetical protein [Candidatus Vogelbacteria bacterium]
MQNLNINDYSSRLTNLPPKLKQAILSADTQSAIENIHQKYKLHIDKLGNLEDITLDVLYGVIKPQEYVDKLESTLGIDRATAAGITVDMNNSLFQPLRDSLMEIGTPSNHVESDRTSILNEIQNPTPTPISGRVVIDSMGEPEISAAQSQELGVRSQELESESQLPTTEPKAFNSIAEEKLAGPVVAEKIETRVDPYLEALN